MPWTLFRLVSAMCWDQSYHLERDAETVASLQADPEATLLVEQTSSWLQVAFGIKPASYDEYYNPLYGDRPDFFGDSRTRQAIASCLDREAIQEAIYAGLGRTLAQLCLCG